MSERERIVDAVGRIERELNNAGGTVSDDTYTVLSRQIYQLGLDSERIGLPTKKLDDLALKLLELHGTDPALLQGMQPGQPVQGQTFDQVVDELRRKAGGRPIQVISNPVNADGTLTPEAQAALDAANASPSVAQSESLAEGVELGDDDFQCESCDAICDIEESNRIGASLICNTCVGKGFTDPAPAPRPRPQKSQGERTRAIEDLFGGH
jgi:hypothetical protein